MRRVTAILVVALVSLSLIAPAVFAAADQSALPSCCRRDGNHHCASNQRDSTSGTLLKAARCPVFPVAKALPGRSFTAGPTDSPAMFAGLVSHPAVHTQTSGFRRRSLDRSSQKRGPP